MHLSSDINFDRPKDGGGGSIIMWEANSLAEKWEPAWDDGEHDV